MTYFLKKKKWMAWVVLLTFLFTSFMPSNILAGNSVAEAADVVAVIGDTEYATLQAAVDAAQDGDTIVLQDTIREFVKIEGKQLTIDTNGQYWVKANTGYASLLTLENNADVTLTGTGILSGASVTKPSASINSGRRIITATDSNVTIDGPTLKNWTVLNPLNETTGTGKGGIVYINHGDFTLLSGAVQDSITSNVTNGGAVYVYDGNFTMEGGSISNTYLGTSTSYGGSVYIEGASNNNHAEVTISGGTITGMLESKTQGATYGGCVAAKFADVTISDGVIENGYAKTQGGNIYVTGDANLYIRGGIIQNGYAGSSGGNIYVIGTTTQSAEDIPQVVMDGGTVQNGVSAGTSTVTVYGGGGIAASRSNVTINGGELVNNSAYNCGGGLYVSEGQLTMTGGNISGNDNYAGKGGGIYASLRGDLNIIGGMISDNSATGDGAGIYMRGMNTYYGFTGCTEMNISEAVTISNNIASGTNSVGGGVYALTDASTTSCRITVGATITENSAAYGGGIGVAFGTASAQRANTFNLTSAAKIYNNHGTIEANNIAGTKRNLTDELFFNYAQKASYQKDGEAVANYGDNSFAVDAYSEYTYKLAAQSAIGGTLSKSNAVGYYCDEEINITKDDCIPEDIVILDPAESSRHYVWIEETIDADGETILAHGEVLTKENGPLYTDLQAAVTAAATGSKTIQVCSTAVLSEDTDNAMDQGITFVRCAVCGVDKAMFTVRGAATIANSVINGQGIESKASMINYSADGHLTIAKGAVIQNGHTTGNGGAISITQGSLTMTGGSIQNNVAEKHGGAIYAYSKIGDNKLSFDGGKICDNEAKSGDGGALYLGYAIAEFGANGGCTELSRNVAGSLGGALNFARGATGTIYRAILTDNVSNIYAGTAGGGAISIYLGGSVQMKNVYITDNQTITGYDHYGALYTCPTGETALFEIDGALAVDNKGQNGLRQPDIMHNADNNNPLAVYVSDKALGGGDITFSKDKAGATVAEPSEYQYSTKSFTLYSRVTEEAKAWAKEAAEKNGVVITGNKSSSAGSAIANNGTLVIGTATKSIQVDKVWQDADGNPLTEHPSQVLVYLTRNGELVAQATRKDAVVVLDEQNGWSYAWTNLDPDPEIAWSFIEAPVSGYSSQLGDEIKDTSTFVGISEDQLYTRKLTNTKDSDVESYDLEFTKQVYGDLADDTAYSFTVKLSDVDGSVYAYYITDADGTQKALQPVITSGGAAEIKLTLQAGQKATFVGLPTDASYEIVEAEGQVYATYVNLASEDTA